MVLGGRQGESKLLLQGGESAQKKCCLMSILRPQSMPVDLVDGLDWSHPSGRKSRTGMAKSTLRQLGELLHKAVDIIPGKYGLED